MSDNLTSYIIYRDKTSNKILRYSIIKKDPDELSLNIEDFNKNEKAESRAELVISDDYKALIDCAEGKKRIKDSDLRSIEDMLDNVQTELYNLKEALK